MSKELDVLDVNRSYDQRRASDDDRYWQRKMNRKNNIRKKKVEATKKKIKYSLYATSVVTILALGNLFSKKINQSKGAQYILNKFENATESYDKIGVADLSDGLVVTRTGSSGGTYEVPLREGIEYINSVGKSEGFSDAERYIIELEKFYGYGEDIIKDCVGEVDKSLIEEAKDMAYHESELENTKGVSR